MQRARRAIFALLAIALVAGILISSQRRAGAADTAIIGVVRATEVRIEPGSVRAGVVKPRAVLLTPVIPGSHTLLEYRDVLVVRHGSTLSATTLFWVGLRTRSIRFASLHTEMTLSVVPSQPSLNSRQDARWCAALRKWR